MSRAVQRPAATWEETEALLRSMLGPEMDEEGIQGMSGRRKPSYGVRPLAPWELANLPRTGNGDGGYRGSARRSDTPAANGPKPSVPYFPKPPLWPIPDPPGEPPVMKEPGLFDPKLRVCPKPMRASDSRSSRVDEILVPDEHYTPTSVWKEGEEVTDSDLANRVMAPHIPTSSLVLFLPGSAGAPFESESQSPAFAYAGHRTIALRWNKETPLMSAGQECDETCFTEDGVPPNCPVFGDEAAIAARAACLEDVRNRKWYEDVVPSFVELIQIMRDSKDPLGGWGVFLDEFDEPIWENVILAGYSEGSIEVAWGYRELVRLGRVPKGLVVISGGAEGAWTGDESEAIVLLGGTPPIASWVTPVAPNERHVGLGHANETWDFERAWDLNGVPTCDGADWAVAQLAGDDEVMPSDYAAFQHCGRLKHTVPVPDFLGMTDHGWMLKDPNLFPAYTYAACRAGGIPELP